MIDFLETCIIDERGLKIASGLAAEVTMKLVEVVRINTRKRPCVEQLPTPTYLRADCITSCANSLIKEECNCGLGISEDVERQCDMKDGVDETCVNGVFDPEDGIIRNHASVSNPNVFNVLLFT